MLVPVLFGGFSPAVHFIPMEESGCSFPSGLFYKMCGSFAVETLHLKKHKR